MLRLVYTRFSYEHLPFSSKGVVVMFFFRVNRLGSKRHRISQSAGIAAAIGLFAVVATPLYFTSKSIREKADILDCLEMRANKWVEAFGWETDIVLVNNEEYTAEIQVSGYPPFPNTSDFQSDDLCGVSSVEIQFIPSKDINLTASTSDTN